MELVLWRHAEAEEGIPDMQRSLTDKGRKQAARMAVFLHSQLPEHARVLVSPALRTQQTAQAFSKHYTTESALAPGASAAAVLQAAGWPHADGCVLIVGHQPTLGMVVAQLLCNQNSEVSIKKGAVWWLSHRVRDGGEQVTLKLAISPEMV